MMLLSTLVSGDHSGPLPVRPGVQFKFKPFWQTVPEQQLAHFCYTDSAPPLIYT